MRKNVLFFLSALFFLWVNTAFSQSTETVFLGAVRSFTINGNINWTYNWTLENPQGTQSSLSSTSIQTEDITFNRLGVYVLNVQATNDLGCLSEWVTKQIEVVEVPNHAPVAINDNYTIKQGTQLTRNLLVNDSDPDLNDILTITAKTVNSAYGTMVILSDGTFTYIPNPDFVGVESFSYEVCDNSTPLLCDNGTITIRVEEIPLGDYAVNDIVFVLAGSEVSGQVLDNDINFPLDKTTVSVPSDSQPVKGSLSITSVGLFTYTPDPTATGVDNFYYQACTTESPVVCDEGNVTVYILPADLSAVTVVAVDDEVETRENMPVTGNVLSNDFSPTKEDLELKTSPITPPGFGVVTISANGDFTYAPNPGFVGNDFFIYEVCGGQTCKQARVTIRVTDAAVDRIFAVDDAAHGYSDEIISGNILSNDILPEGVSFNLNTMPVVAPKYGNVAISSTGNYQYTPGTNALPYVDHFVYEICDGDGYCSNANVFIVVSKRPEPQGPVILVENGLSQSTGCCQNGLQLDASGATGTSELLFLWEPSVGLDNATSSTPVFTGTETTLYKLTVTDKNGISSTETVTVEVRPCPQVVTNNQIFVNSPTDVIILDASASTGSELAYDWWAEDTGIIVSGTTSSTPQVMGIGKYYLEITDSYGCTALDSVMVGVYIQVEAVNDTAHVLVNNSVDINVLRNDRPQGDLDPKTVNIVNPPANGIAVLSTDSVITYTPNQYFTGQDNFIYAVCNYSNECDEATVLVMVNDEALFIPTAFSPNGDGYNDYYVIKGLGNYEKVSFKVFNRWGGLVYESGNYGVGEGKDGFWDGAGNKGIRVGNGQVPSGTYYYILDLGAGNEKLSGFIYLDR